MKILISALLCCCLSVAAHAQQVFRIFISSEEQAPLAGATVLWVERQQSAIADTNGIAVFSAIPNGTQTFSISYTGYGEKKINFRLPLNDPAPVHIILEEAEEEEEEVIVTATRVRRLAGNIPTRTEVIAGEELEEKANMKPGDIRMLLNETTGIQTQQTSATSYNSSIRIQGLDGRYTQLLRDGYPLYAGFSGGLSLLQIAPLDLKQVEVIKGSASTLYGGGAIAGLVNLVSKTPGEERELDFLTNFTSAGGLDLSGFYSERYGQLGITVFGSRNSGSAFDPADIGLTAIPEFERYVIHPRIFFYSENTSADLGFNYTTEDRIGGSMDYIKNGGDGYFERNNTDRITTQFGITHHLNENSDLQFKNSYSRFDRKVAIPGYVFDALQQSSYTELSWSHAGAISDWVAGVNILTDDLREGMAPPSSQRNYRYITYGAFIQNVWAVTEKFSLETGFRGDYVNEYGFEWMPRISAMYKLSSKFTTRLGGGYGYKTPTIFTEEAERRQFQQILPIDVNSTRNERSVGGNWDIDFRTQIGAVGFSLNHLFFYTRLNRPLVLTDRGNGQWGFTNASGYLDTKGMETNIRLSYSDFKLFLGYTYTDAQTHFSTKEWLPLTARHRLNNVLMYEVEEKWKIGLEAYYYSRQRLSDGGFGKAYWITGLMMERIWEKFSVFLNFENFSNTRQTRFDTIYTGSINNPVFRDIYAPVDGFVVNGGVKLKL